MDNQLKLMFVNEVLAKRKTSKQLGHFYAPIKANDYKGCDEATALAVVTLIIASGHRGKTVDDLESLVAMLTASFAGTIAALGMYSEDSLSITSQTLEAHGLNCIGLYTYE